MPTKSFDKNFVVKTKEAYIKLVEGFSKECPSPKPKINIQSKIKEGKITMLEIIEKNEKYFLETIIGECELVGEYNSEMIIDSIKTITEERLEELEKTPSDSMTKQDHKIVMAIVNIVLETAGCSVEQRQKVNDECDEAVYRKLKEFTKQL